MGRLHYGGKVKIKQLLEDWQEHASEKRTSHEYKVRLPLHDAARLRALAEMYPGRNEEALITDLLSAALDELEEAMPYVQGDRVIARDEFNDPIYEDAGPTPRFSELTEKYTRRLDAELKKKESSA